MTTVTEQTLLEGSWLALEQAGRLLDDAIALAQMRRFGTALAIAMFGREQLGRSRLLRACAAQARAGKIFCAKKIAESCEDHVRKQAAANFSTTLRPPSDSELGKALSALSERDPMSVEWQDAHAMSNAAVEKKRKRQSAERASMRCAGLYVDIEPTGTAWRSPRDINEVEATESILAAVHDYNLEVNHLQ